MGRPSNTEQRRAQIADGLLTVMAETGYPRASIAAIARAAGLAPGLVHYHFRDKEEILTFLFEALREGVRAREEALRARVSGGDPTPLEALACFVDARLALGRGADARAVRAWVVIGTEAIGQPPVQERYARAIREELERLRALCAEVLRASGRSARPARKVAAALLSTIEGAYRLSAGAPGALPRGFAAPAVREMAQALLGAEDDR